MKEVMSPLGILLGVLLGVLVTVLLSAIVNGVAELGTWAVEEIRRRRKPHE